MMKTAAMLNDDGTSPR